MATNRLTDNDVSSLAQIFCVTLQSYCQHYSPMEKDYFKDLSTIVGLGFTTVLIDGGLLPIYERHLQTFIRYRDFKAHPESINTLSRAIADMISDTVFLFRLIPPLPPYYDVFVKSVKSTFNHVGLCESEEAKEAERLTQKLFPKR